MSFIADTQTLNDLNLLGKYKNDSVYALFNKVCTTGGSRLLEQMFRDPLSDYAEINNRSAIFEYFKNRKIEFPFGQEQFCIMENHLRVVEDSVLFLTGLSIFRKRVLALITRDGQYKIIQEGVANTLEILHTFYAFVMKMDDSTGRNIYQVYIEQAKEIFKNKRFDWLRNGKVILSLSMKRIIHFDYLLKHELYEEIKKLCEIIYLLDVYIAVGNVARERDFNFAHALPRRPHVFRAEQLYHPGLRSAVANSVTLGQRSNVIFLTGANMAGKSTFMKSFGIAVYLAHMGFPVAAKNMEFSITEGIYSSINVPDDLGLGLSHFYAEVLRVKKVAQDVGQGKDLVVIFDELFKGTNVKDAFDATLAVTEAFGAYRNCLFIISTHIIEVGNVLKECCNNLQYLYFPTIIEHSAPKYTYKLQKGITSDRHGMMIIEKEGILDEMYNYNKQFGNTPATLS